ncbi:hypothetical protein FSARC_14911 [Fusarium sarcochroum]|uniref:Nephrocystin 3-like N-terminal domain-containing protein n=1 Tax=Fusarium sarcochroum TaxID=1208366 RepID=A0A8H4SPZ1_9HYPO|nr:hypothetical protein FSARC_14911 [Fusarium sarcochroum]
MSHPPHLNQGGSNFEGTTVGQRVSLGNKTCYRDNTTHVTYHYYDSGHTRSEDRDLSHEISCRDQEPRGQKRKLEDDHEQVDQNRYHVLLESLRFKQIDARYENIKRAHGKTCKWVLNRPEYLDWLNPDKTEDHHGFLWVKGKPGAGKSTLMKFILSTARTKMKNKVIISFFFNARGETLEKSTVGMYRSLLLQLLERLPRLQRVLNPMLVSGINENQNWSVESLKELFEQAVQSLEDSSLVVFIDALDECNETEIRNMISFFGDLGDLAVSAGVTFQVCFASRHYPYITIARKIDLVLEGQEGHEQDIISYLDSELKIGNNRVANEIRAELKDKASGVFMWVVLVVGILQREHDYGRNHTLKQKLREIPGDLHHLFRDILTRDNENKDGLLLCIQLVLFARKPLRPEQLYFAIRSGEDKTILPWDREEIPESVISKFILSSSKGLAETTKSKREPTVQFIHESVRDFLLKEGSLKDTWPNLNGNLQAESHQRLKQCCFDYTTAYTSILNASAKEIAVVLDKTDESFPFLRYAVQSVLYHANAAQEWGVSQTSFLQMFPLPDWVDLDNVFEKKKVRRHTREASLLYILAEHNLAHLIEVCSSNQSCFLVEKQRYGAPILAALATGSHAAVRELMKAEVKDEPLTSPLHALCDQYSLDRGRRGGIGRDFKYPNGRTLFSYLVEDGDEALVAFSRALGQINTELEERTRDGRTALSLAASAKSSGLVQTLLDVGAVVNTADNRGRTPLFHAAENCDEATVRSLVSKGANIERADKYERTPLSHAIRNSTPSGSMRVLLELLLSHTIIDKPDFRGWTPLMHAAKSSNLDAMRLLIDRGADINQVDNDGYTPLMRAAFGDFTAGTKLLVEQGADINQVDNDGYTPLMRAAVEGLTAAMKLLIEQGADVNLADNSGRTALLSAATEGSTDSMRLLIDQGASVDATDTTNGRTILSYAVESSHQVIVLSLLDLGAPINKACTTGRTPLSYATEPRFENHMVELLLSRGAAVDTPDVNGRTPLSHAATSFSNENVFKLLLDHGAAVDSTDNNGRTPLSYASDFYFRSENVVQLLLDRGAAVVSIDNPFEDE